MDMVGHTSGVWKIKNLVLARTRKENRQMRRPMSSIYRRRRAFSDDSDEKDVEMSVPGNELRYGAGRDDGLDQLS